MSPERILFGAALVLFTGLTLYQLALPGLHYDEAFEAVPAMQLLLNQPVTTFRGNGVHLDSQLFPLMTQDYIGAINTYAVIPFFALLGISPISLRLMAIVVGLLTLWLTYRLADSVYGAPASGIAALLLAVNPTFVFWSRQGVFVTSVTAAIGLGAVLMGWHWWRTGARRYAVASAFLLGLGLYAKFLFLWLILALALAVVLLNLDRLRYIRNRLLQLPVGWCVLAFLLGCAPLIVYNLQTGGTFRSVGENLTTSYYGTNNLALFPNLLERVNQFVAVLTGSHFWYLGGTYANWISLVVFLVALGTGLTLLATDANRGQGRRVLFPFVVIGGVVLASCATVSALWVTHFAILSPWPALALAGTVGILLQRNEFGPVISRTILLPIVLLAIMGVSWLADIVTDVRYHRSLTISGGLSAHSDAVTDLAQWLAASERRGVPVVAMDWGIAAPVAFLTQGNVTPVEAFGYDWETGSGFAARLEQFLADPASIYLWRAPDEIIFDRSSDFRTLYAPHDLEEEILAAFYERNGRPVLGATGLVPNGTAVNAPQRLGEE
jgi:4-amino-4-deoxy-L-arabinose transferase-like glycosyltransferase